MLASSWRVVRGWPILAARVGGPILAAFFAARVGILTLRPLAEARLLKSIGQMPATLLPHGPSMSAMAIFRQRPATGDSAPVPYTGCS
jgi:hypothetical protein